MKKEDRAGSAGASPGPKTALNLEPGETFDQYEICGFIFRIGPPRLTFRSDGDKVFCRVETEMETIRPARSAPNPSSGEGPSQPQAPRRERE